MTSSLHHCTDSCTKCGFPPKKDLEPPLLGGKKKSCFKSLRRSTCFCRRGSITKNQRHLSNDPTIKFFIVFFSSLMLVAVVTHIYRRSEQQIDSPASTDNRNIAYTERRGYINNKRYLQSSYDKEKKSFRRKIKPKKPSLGEPFNPDSWSNATSSSKKHYIIVYWSKIRGHVARMQNRAEYTRDKHVWPYTYAGEKGECPVSCELTNDRSRAEEADAFVVHSRLTDVTDQPPFHHLAPWILQNNENPVYTPALGDARIMSKFNLLISYRLDSDFPSPIYPKPNPETEPIPFKERLGDVLAVFSKCEVVRTEYMRQLMQYIDVHSYGACLKNRDGLIGLYGQINGKYVFKDYKVVLTRFYKFSLVFMNQDCDFFVDDRLYHALDTGSIPVYMGTDKIDQFLPGNLRSAIIRVSDFSSPAALADYLRYLSGNETAFNEYLKWRDFGIGDLGNTTIGRWWEPKFPLFCQVCMRLSQGGLHPGLDVDKCRPREYKDWNLLPPYGDNSHIYGVNYDDGAEFSQGYYDGDNKNNKIFMYFGFRSFGGMWIFTGFVVMTLSYSVFRSVFWARRLFL